MQDPLLILPDQPILLPFDLPLLQAPAALRRRLGTMPNMKLLDRPMSGRPLRVLMPKPDLDRQGHPELQQFQLALSHQIVRRCHALSMIPQLTVQQLLCQHLHLPEEGEEITTIVWLNS
jgi:hypothetical protein